MTRSNSSLFDHIPHIGTETCVSPEQPSGYGRIMRTMPWRCTRHSSSRGRSRLLNER